MCPQPCIHKDYLYAAFKVQTEQGRIPQLFRSNLNEPLTWQKMELPSSFRPHLRLHLFSHRDELYVALAPEDAASPDIRHIIYARKEGMDWRRVCSFPERKWRFSLHVVGEELLVVGGAKSIAGKIGANSVHSLSLAVKGTGTTDWIALQDLPICCIKPHLVSYGKRIHAIGYSTLDKKLERRRILSMPVDGASREWSWGPLEDTPYAVAAAAVFNDRLLAVGGFEENEVINSAYLYRDSDNKWLPLPPLCSTRGMPQCLVFRNSLICIGGKTSSYGLHKDIEVLKLD